MTPAEELQALRRMKELEDKASATKAEPSFLDKAAGMVPDFVKNVGTAAYKGVAGLAASAGDALAGSYDMTDMMRGVQGQPVRELDRTGPVSRALEETGYQPKTQAEKYVNAGVRGATGALASPAALANIPRALIGGAGAGLGGEAAGQIPSVQGTAMEPAARIAGSMLGGVAAGAATLPFKNSGELAREMFVGTKKPDVEAAKRAMVEAKIAGVPINLDQAMGVDTNITNMVKTLVGRKEGQTVVDQLRAQPEQSKGLMKRLTDLMPGSVKEPAKIANESQEAATNALARARADRTAQTAPLFQQSGDLPPAMAQTMVQQVRGLAQQAPDTNKGALLEDLATVLERAGKRNTTQSPLLGPNGQPLPPTTAPINIQELNASLRSFGADMKNINMNSRAADKEAVGAVQAVIKDLRDQIGGVSPKFKEANDLYSHLSSTVVDPLKKSVIGRVSGITGDLADKEAVNKLLPILAKGRNPEAKSSDILKFAAETADTPEVFQNAVKTNFSNAVAAAEQQVSGKLSPNLSSALERTLLGDAAKRQGMKDQLEALAIHQGKPRDAIYPGFMKALKVISAAGKRPGALGPNSAALDEVAGQSTIAQGLRSVGLSPGKPAAFALQRYLSGDAYRTLADNLTTPEGVAKLQQLAKVPYLSPKAQVLVNSLTTTAVTDNSPEVTNITSGD